MSRLSVKQVTVPLCSTDPGPQEEDELYEECLEETTKVFLVQQEELVHVPEYSNVPLRHAMLNNKQARTTCGLSVSVQQLAALYHLKCPVTLYNL